MLMHIHKHYYILHTVMYSTFYRFVLGLVWDSQVDFERTKSLEGLGTLQTAGIEEPG